MKLACIFFSFMLVFIGCNAENPDQVWEYKYEVLWSGKKSETITGKLLYKNKEIPKIFRNIIVPIGEFVYIPHGLASNHQLRWVPVLNDAPVTRDLEIKQYFEESKYRKTIRRLRKSEGDLMGKRIEKGWFAGEFQDDSKFIPEGWIYVVDDKVWLNPEKMEEYLATKMMEEGGRGKYQAPN